MSTPIKFQLGQLVGTPGALEAINRNGAESTTLSLIMRHQSGDWGDVDDEDKASNDEALKYGSRVLSAYHLEDGTKLWIITEADRSATTILLPEEY